MPFSTSYYNEKNVGFFVSILPNTFSLFYLQPILKLFSSLELHCRKSTQHRGSNVDNVFLLQPYVTNILLSLFSKSSFFFFFFGEERTLRKPAFINIQKNPPKLTVRLLWSLYIEALRADVALLGFGIKYSLASFRAKNYLST